jgi:hypothetical protein
MRAKNFLISTLILFALFLLVPAPVSAQTQVIAWDSSLHFLLPATKTIVSFGNTAYFSSFEWDSFNASSIKFYNFQVSGDEATLSSFGLNVQNANATVNYANKGGKAEIVLNAPSGAVSSLTIYYPGNYPPTVTVGGETIQDSNYFKSYGDWSLHQPPAVFLNETAKTLTVKAKHASPVVVTFYWPGLPTITGGGGGGATSTSATYTPITIPTVEVPSPLVNVGLAAIVIVAVGAFISSQLKPKKTSEKWRKNMAASNKKTRWKKKKTYE